MIEEYELSAQEQQYKRSLLRFLEEEARLGMRRVDVRLPRDSHTQCRQPEAAHEHDHARCVNLSCGQTELALARPASAAVCSAVFRGVPWRGVCARRAAAGGKGA